MALSEFGALTREFYIAEIRTWDNHGGKFGSLCVCVGGGGGGRDITRFYCTYK